MVYYKNLNSKSIERILKPYGLQLNQVDLNADIPHSYWGAPEAGRQKDHLYIRGDTPIHSVLHEACHYICMSAEQRTDTHNDAKGSVQEENATCYLQILLADHIDNYDREQIMKDMDYWGYSFRLGSAYRWFTEDAQEVCQWLLSHQLINAEHQITWQLRSN